MCNFTPIFSKLRNDLQSLSLRRVGLMGKFVPQNKHKQKIQNQKQNHCYQLPLLNNDFRSQHDKFVYGDGLKILDLIERTNFQSVKQSNIFKRVKGKALVVWECEGIETLAFWVLLLQKYPVGDIQTNLKL